MQFGTFVVLWHTTGRINRKQDMKLGIQKWKHANQKLKRGDILTRGGQRSGQPWRRWLLIDRFVEATAVLSDVLVKKGMVTEQAPPPAASHHAGRPLPLSTFRASQSSAVAWVTKLSILSDLQRWRVARRQAIPLWCHRVALLKLS